MSVHGTSGAASFAACLELFRRYPLAVTPRPADGGYRSMVLTNRAAGPAGFFVLTQASDDLFVIRPWNGDGVDEGIWPGEPVSGMVHRVITGGMPVPHDGALLGWVTDSQVTAMLAVHCRPPETWGAPVPVPEIRVMPMAGTSELLHWPPFTASPLGDGRLWEHVEWGQIVDIAPLVIQSSGRAFWVPSPDSRSARHGCVVITDDLPADEYWLPAGVYMDHWTLREGIQAPPVGRLLTLPGVADLTRGSGDPVGALGRLTAGLRESADDGTVQRSGTPGNGRVWVLPSPRGRWRCRAGMAPRPDAHDDDGSVTTRSVKARHPA